MRLLYLFEKITLKQLLTCFLLITFSVSIAQSPVLIIDLDGNTNSGPAIETAIVNNGLSADYVTVFPTILSSYEVIFVCLGTYNANQALSATEGSNLANFVNSGGCLYMEGADTWVYDPATLVHPLFNINGTSDGSGDLSFIVGQAATLSEGLSFNYVGDNSYIDQIEAIAPAQVLFGNTPVFYDCAVIHETNTYKTIGASFEFGGLEDDTLSGSTKDLLMEKYLQFFDLLPENSNDIGIVDIISPANNLNQGDTVPVEVVLKNFGGDTLYSASIEYALNAGTSTTYSWSGMLAFNETDTVSIGNLVIPSANYDLCAWTVSAPDSITYNDTLCMGLTIVPALDAGVIEIYQPQGNLVEGDSIDVIVEVKNFGLDTLSAMDITVMLNGGFVFTESWTGALLSGETDSVVFSSVVIPLGNSEICVNTQLTGDQNVANDTLCAAVFGNPANDAGVFEIMELPQSNGEYKVFAKIMNSGADDLTSVELHWSIDLLQQSTVYWTGLVLPGAISDPILLGSSVFSAGIYTITLNTALPNGVVDIFNADDTLQTSFEFLTASVVDTFPYCESYETGLGNWIQNTWDEMDWTQDNNGTPTNNTGPSSAYDGDYYLYTEASYQNTGDIASIEVVFDFSTFQNPEIVFNYHMYGSQMGTLHLDVFDSIWHEDVWMLSGNQFNQWYQANINIVDFGGLDHVVVRFRGERGFGSRSDITIDNFCINEILSTDVGLSEILSPVDYVCSNSTEPVFVVAESFGVDPVSNIPVMLEFVDPIGVSTTIYDTIAGPLNLGDTDTIQFMLSGFASIGTYSFSASVNLTGDQDSSNDTIVGQVQSIMTISSFPYDEDFENGNNYFLLSSASLSDVGISGDTINSYLRITGGNVNQGWTGGATTTPQNAWVDNVTHIASATTCTVDATQLAGLTLEFDLRQTYSWTQLYSWFRLLVNDTVQVADINGVSNFNPVTALNDTFQTIKFNLNQYAGTIFTLTFQGSCKYNDIYNPTNYPEGDQALIDNILLYEPLVVDVGIQNVNTPQGEFCGGGWSPIEIVLANYGLSSAYDIPIGYTITYPDGTQQALSVLFTDTIGPGGMNYFIVDSVNTLQAGEYVVSLATNLANDGDPANDSNYSMFVVVGEINSFPFEENFVSNVNYYFNISSNNQAAIYYFDDNGDMVLRMEGRTNSAWSGQSGNVSHQNAWFDNVQHHAFAQTCNVDATGLTYLNLDIDFRQNCILGITDYSWFRVLINDSIQIADINGISDFNPTYPQGDPYELRTFDLSAYAGTQFNITLQSSCKYDSTYSYQGVPYPGGDAVFIREIALYEPPPVDISVISINNLPEPDCDLSSAQSILIEFANLGTDTLFPGASIPFNLDINGLPILELFTLQDTLVYGATSFYTFMYQADLSNDGVYQIMVSSAYPGDAILENDTAHAMVTNILTVSNYPFLQDFESNYDGWMSKTINGVDSWEIGIPDQTLIDTAHSGLYAWMTDLNGNYANFAEMHLYTPCFDFSDMQTIVVSFWLNIDTEADWDGMIMEGTADGLIWTKVGVNDVNFYNSNNNASSNPVLEAPWWSGNLGGWVKFTGTLNEFAGESSVRLRFRFESDNNTNAEGIAMDDFFVDELFSCSIEGDNELCEGESVTLYALATGGDEPYTYQWNPLTGLSDPNVAHPVASPITTTTYSVLVTDASGEQVVADITLTVLPAPVVDLGADIVGTPPFVLNAGPGASFFWSTFETTQTISVSQPGVYWVTVTDANGCQGSDTIEITIAGIDEFYTGGVLIYPNPGKGQFNCSFRMGLLKEVRFTITDILGKEIYHEIMPGIAAGEERLFDISYLTNGTYMIYIRSENINVVQKLIIQK